MSFAFVCGWGDKPQSYVEHHFSATGNMRAADADVLPLLINVCFTRMITKGRYQESGLHWDKSACDLLNEICRSKGKMLVHRIARDPTVLELLLYRNGFASIDDSVLLRDGSHIDRERFLDAVPRMTEDYFRGEQQGFTVYSRANWIFAVVLLEELGQDLSGVLWQEVLNPFGLRQTLIHREKIEASSTLEDIALLIQELLKGMDSVSDVFTHSSATEFFGKKAEHNDDEGLSLAGLYCNQVWQSDRKWVHPKRKYRDVLYSGTMETDQWVLGCYILLSHRAFFVGKVKRPSDDARSLTDLKRSELFLSTLNGDPNAAHDLILSSCWRPIDRCQSKPRGTRNNSTAATWV